MTLPTSNTTMSPIIPVKGRNFLIAAALLIGLVPCAFAKPLKVFILAGQSNMQGHVNISTFDSMAADGNFRPTESFASLLPQSRAGGH